MFDLNTHRVVSTLALPSSLGAHVTLPLHILGQQGNKFTMDQHVRADF